MPKVNVHLFSARISCCYLLLFFFHKTKTQSPTLHPLKSSPFPPPPLKRKQFTKNSLALVVAMPLKSHPPSRLQNPLLAHLIRFPPRDRRNSPRPKSLITRTMKACLMLTPRRQRVNQPLAGVSPHLQSCLSQTDQSNRVAGVIANATDVPLTMRLSTTAMMEKRMSTH